MGAHRHRNDEITQQIDLARAGVDEAVKSSLEARKRLLSTLPPKHEDDTGELENETTPEEEEP